MNRQVEIEAGQQSGQDIPHPDAPPSTAEHFFKVKSKEGNRPIEELFEQQKAAGVRQGHI